METSWSTRVSTAAAAPPLLAKMAYIAAVSKSRGPSSRATYHLSQSVPSEDLPVEGLSEVPGRGVHDLEEARLRVGASSGGSGRHVGEWRAGEQQRARRVVAAEEKPGNRKSAARGINGRHPRRRRFTRDRRRHHAGARESGTRGPLNSRIDEDDSGAPARKLGSAETLKKTGHKARTEVHLSRRTARPCGTVKQRSGLRAEGIVRCLRDLSNRENAIYGTDRRGRARPTSTLPRAPRRLRSRVLARPLPYSATRSRDGAKGASATTAGASTSPMGSVRLAIPANTEA